FFSSRRRHTSSKRDWSSDVCSSDLTHAWKLAVRLQDAVHHHMLDLIHDLLIDRPPVPIIDSQHCAPPFSPCIKCTMCVSTLRVRSEERRVGKAVMCWRARRRS